MTAIDLGIVTRSGKSDENKGVFWNLRTTCTQKVVRRFLVILHLAIRLLLDVTLQF